LTQIHPDELKLYCMRLSSTRQISRNGWRDPDIGWFYYAEWMAGYKGQKVYVRRDPARYQTGWFFLAKTHEYIGKAQLIPPAPAVALNDLQREHVAEAQRRKSRANKMAKELADVGSPDDVFEQSLHHAAGLESDEVENTANSKRVKVTPAAQALEKEEEYRKTGTWDELPVDEPPARRVIKLFESDQ